MTTLRLRATDFFANLNPLITIFWMCVFFASLTYVIPGGEFVRHEVVVLGEVQRMVDPASFHAAPSVPQGFPQLWTVFMRGALEGAERSFLILISAGAITAIIATGAINAGIALLIRKTGRLGLGFIPIMVFAVGLCSATFGMYEEAIPFILIIAPLMLSLGFDSMLGVFVMYWSIAVGFACGITNPYNVGIAQAIAEVRLYSGTGFRVLVWVVFMTITSLWIMRYARQVRKDPSRSLSRDEDVANRARLHTNPEAAQDYPMTPRRALALAFTAAFFVLLMVGLMKWHWNYSRIGSLYFWMGIVVPVAGGLSFSKMIEENIEGMRSVMIAVVMMSAAQIIFFILKDANILDTILHFMAGYMGHLPHFLIAYVMFSISAVMASLLGTASGTAATVMPILGPLADVLHFSRQIVVLAFQLATGAFNFWMPWDGIAFTICSMAGVGFFKYVRHTAKFAVFVYVPTALVMLLISVLTHYR